MASVSKKLDLEKSMSRLLKGTYMIPQIERSEKKFSPNSNIRCCKFMEPEAIFLKRLHYWISRGKYGVVHGNRIWIYNTIDQWAEQLKSKGIVGNVIPAVTKLKSKLFDRQNQISSKFDRILEKSFVSIKIMLPFVHKATF